MNQHRQPELRTPCSPPQAVPACVAALAAGPVFRATCRFLAAGRPASQIIAAARRRGLPSHLVIACCAGLQLIVVIGRPFPVSAGVLLARWAWRYRSEIAPAATAGAVLAVGW
jgi:hypothetical protein